MGKIVRFESPDRIEIGKEFPMKIVEVTESELLFVQAEGEPEAFVVLEGKKCWIQTWKTAEKKGWDKLLKDRVIMPLAELNRKYPTGDTILWKDGEFVMGDKPRDIYFPKGECWHPEIKGLLTLNEVPNGKEIKDLGFNTAWPFKTQEEQLLEFSRLSGQIIFMKTTRDENKFNVLGYCLEDEPENRQQSEPLPVLWERLEMLRLGTQKPVGCIFMDITLDPNNENYEKYQDLIMAMDWIGVTLYPYDEKIDNPIVRMEEGYERLKNFPKPIILISQACFGGSGNDLTKPNILAQNEFWRSRGYGIIWYVWSGQGAGIKEAFKNEIKEANEWEVG